MIGNSACNHLFICCYIIIILLNHLLLYNMLHHNWQKQHIVWLLMHIINTFYILPKVSKWPFIVQTSSKLEALVLCLMLPKLFSTIRHLERTDIHWMIFNDNITHSLSHVKDLGPQIIRSWLLYKNSAVVWYHTACSHGPSSHACQWRSLFLWHSFRL